MTRVVSFSYKEEGKEGLSGGRHLNRDGEGGRELVKKEEHMHTESTQV